MAVTQLEAGALLQVLEDDILVVVGREETEGTFEIFDVDGPAGSGPPPHAHPWVETFVVLDGQLAVSVDGEERLLGVGQSAVVGNNHLHTFQVRSTRCRFLTITNGTGAGDFFADMAANVPAGPPSADTLPLIIEVAKRGGLTSPLF